MHRRLVGVCSIADAGLAVGLLCVKLLTLAAGAQPGAGDVGYVAAFFWTLPLAVRSRYPLGVAVVIAVTNIVEIAVGGYHDSIVALIALVLALYSLGAHAATRVRLMVGLAVVAASGAYSASAQPDVHLTGVLGDVAVLLGPLFAGLWVRQQRLRARTLEQLAEQLEREREERARTAVAEERTRIARELHDEVAHAMSVIALQADAAEGALARDPALVQQPLVAIRKTAREALVDMRRVLGVLRGDGYVDRAPEPGLARLGELIEQARAGGLSVDLQVGGAPLSLPPAIDLTAYRVLQEGLTNVRKHSGAACAHVSVRYNGDTVDVEVTDDGNGTGTGERSGYGLAGIRERVVLLGGEFVAGPRTPGFVLRVTLPVS